MDKDYKIRNCAFFLLFVPPSPQLFQTLKPIRLLFRKYLHGIYIHIYIYMSVFHFLGTKNGHFVPNLSPPKFCIFSPKIPKVKFALHFWSLLFNHTTSLHLLFNHTTPFDFLFNHTTPFT